MGIVSDYLCNLITKQVDTYRLVVWFDPDKTYRDFVQNLKLPDITVAVYEGSFFALRHQIEPLMEGDSPPRLVVYVPLTEEATQHALIKLTKTGRVIKHERVPWQHSTKLSTLAKMALKNHPEKWTEEAANEIARQIESGMVDSLEEVDRVADKGSEIAGVIPLIFGTGNPQEIALDFLASDRYDKDIVDKKATVELINLLQNTFEVELPDGETPNAYRTRFARHILTTDLVTNLSGEAPAPLTTLKIASKPAAREACTLLAKTWRLWRDFRESYVVQANWVEKELNLSRIDFERDQITDVETFLEVERSLQHHIETTLLEEATDDLIEIARTRQSSFWSEYLPDVQAQWALIAVSGQVLLEATRIEKEMKSSAADIKILFSAYTETGHPWCLLDTYHRHMERRYHHFDFDLGERHQTLDQLIAKAWHRYMEVGSTLAERFLQSYRQAKFQVPRVLRQTEIYSKYVAPNLSPLSKKVAYVGVDALRYEMARELAQILSEEFDPEIQAILGTVPTITETGMAAHLPGAQEAATVVSVGEGKLGLEIHGTILKDRKDRVKFLKANVGVQVFEAKLEDLLPSPKKKVREGIRDVNLILITSQEIDALCEGDNVPLARRHMDDILDQLRRVFRVLMGLGVEVILVTADHGYLFGEELGSDMKIDAPGGDTVDLHRQVWIGRGGTFARGKDALSGTASMALFGNTNQPVEVMVRSSHLFVSLPDIIREAMAFLDRVHFYLPGWEVPKMRVEFFTNHYGFVVDYLAEALRELRQHNFTEMMDHHFSLGSHLNAHDVKAVRKTVTGLIKLSYPQGEVSKEEMAELVELALEGRRRVKEQLKKMGSFEYHQTSFSCIDNETREERFIGVPEEGGHNLISADPLAPGSVYTISVDDQGKVGLYRLEVGCSPGTGKLKIAGSLPTIMKGSIQRAYAYIQGHKVNMGIAQAIDITDFHVEAIDLLNNYISCDAGIALVIAIYSAVKKHPALPALLILGDLSIQGNIKAARSLSEPLQVGRDN